MSIFATAVAATVGKRSFPPRTGQVYIKHALFNACLECPWTDENAKVFQSFEEFQPCDISEKSR